MRDQPSGLVTLNVVRNHEPSGRARHRPGRRGTAHLAPGGRPSRAGREKRRDRVAAAVETGERIAVSAAPRRRAACNRRCRGMASTAFPALANRPAVDHHVLPIGHVADADGTESEPFDAHALSLLSGRSGSPSAGAASCKTSPRGRCGRAPFADGQDLTCLAAGWRQWLLHTAVVLGTGTAACPDAGCPGLSVAGAPGVLSACGDGGDYRWWARLGNMSGTGDIIAMAPVTWMSLTRFAPR
jgi:hypothetical protein